MPKDALPPPPEATAAHEVLQRLQKGDVRTALEFTWTALTNGGGELFGEPFSKFRFIEQFAAQLQMLHEEASADRDSLLPPFR